jgi:hypothetical protein
MEALLAAYATCHAQQLRSPTPRVVVHRLAGSMGWGNRLRDAVKDFWCEGQSELRRDWARCCHVCTGTSVPALGSPLLHVHRDRARPDLSHLNQDWAHPCYVCTRTGSTPGHICSGTRPSHI